MEFESSLILIFLPIAAVVGYHFISVWNCTRFMTMYKLGYNLFFTSSYSGCFTLIILFSLVVALLDQFNERFRIDIFNFILQKAHLEIIAIIVTLILSFIFPYMLNVVFRDTNKYEQHAANYFGNSLFLKIQESFEKRCLIELTLKNGERFVGIPSKKQNLRCEYVDLILYSSRTCDNITTFVQVKSIYGIEGGEEVKQASNHQVSIREEEILIVRQFSDRFDQTDSSRKISRFCKTWNKLFGAS